MKTRLVFGSLALLALFLALAPAALASNKWYVDGVNGSDNNDGTTAETACKTIGHAISLASEGDSIMVAAATYKESIIIHFSLRVIGSGANKTIIDGKGTNNVVHIKDGHVLLSKLTIQNGYSSVFGLAGGIENRGRLTVNNCTIRGNFAVRTYGAGIENTGGTLTINKSTISGNTALYYDGGGVANVGGTLTIKHSTISGNISSEGGGGGIFNSTVGPMTIDNSTISGNTTLAGADAGGDGGGIENDGTLTISNSTVSGNSAVRGSGGIYSCCNGTTTLKNSIVASNGSGGNCSGPMISNGYNLSGDNTCNFNNTGDLNNTDPRLGPLQNNGGPTQTMKLLRGSPAIDAGNPSGCTDGNGDLLKTDQRGAPRPDAEDNGVGCDIGAFERQKD